MGAKQKEKLAASSVAIWAQPVDMGFTPTAPASARASKAAVIGAQEGVIWTAWVSHTSIQSLLRNGKTNIVIPNRNFVEDFLN